MNQRLVPLPAPGFSCRGVLANWGVVELECSVRPASIPCNLPVPFVGEEPVVLTTVRILYSTLSLSSHGLWALFHPEHFCHAAIQVPTRE